MTKPNLSDSDQAKIDSGDYVLDPVFGVQPATVEVQRRDRAAAVAGTPAPPPPAPPVADPAPPATPARPTPAPVVTEKTSNA